MHDGGPLADADGCQTGYVTDCSDREIAGFVNSTICLGRRLALADVHDVNRYATAAIYVPSIASTDGLPIHR